MLLSKLASRTPAPPRAAALERGLNALIALIVIVRLAWIFSALLRGDHVPLRLAQDDFYYYLRPAQNLAWHHRSVFFGNTLTNGYHPLYFALLTLMSVFVHTLRGVFRFLWVLDTVSAAAIFLLTRQLFRRMSSHATLASGLLANALATLMVSLCYTQICDQMEVTLALPLGFAFLLAGFARSEELTPRRTAAMGLLGGLTFLARLDAGLLIFLLVLGMLFSQPFRAALKPANIAAFAVACLPLPLLYFGLNVHYFHALLPVSGMAKELHRGHAMSVLLPASFSGTSKVLVEAALATGVLAIALRERLFSREKVFLFAVLVTPFLFYGLEMLISDWPVWNWYFYALRFSATGTLLLAIAMLDRWLPSSGGKRVRTISASPLSAGVLCVLTLAVLLRAHYKVDHWMTEIQHAAGVLDTFAETHPGVYAMGDRAGMFAITTPNPVLQTEGLVMDRAYLQHIKAQDDLRSVLAGYGVNYFVAFVFKSNFRNQFVKGCFRAMEPSIAGPSALRMRSTFCGPPLFQFPGFDGRYVVYPILPR